MLSPQLTMERIRQLRELARDEEWEALGREAPKLLGMISDLHWERTEEGELIRLRQLKEHVYEIADIVGSAFEDVDDAPEDIVARVRLLKTQNADYWRRLREQTARADRNHEWNIEIGRERQDLRDKLRWAEADLEEAGIRPSGSRADA